MAALSKSSDIAVRSAQAGEGRAVGDDAEGLVQVSGQSVSAGQRVVVPST